jgi:hypothetical protein
MHTCAVGVDESLYCWGSLGRGSVITSGGMTGTMVLHGADIGLPLRIGFERGVPASGVRLVRVSADTHRACAVLPTSIRCWSTSNVSESSHGLAILEATSVPLSDVNALTMAHGSVCAIAGAVGTRHLYCWAHESQPAQASWPAGSPEPTDVAMGAMYACVVDAAGQASCWHSLIGDFWRRRPDRVLSWPGKPKTRAIAIGESLVCTVNSVGEVDCFLADDGGLTDEALRRSWATPKLGPHPIAGVDEAVDLSLGAGRDAFGYGYGCALRKFPDPQGAQVFCWGDNELGQLGTGDLTPSLVAKRVVGASSR